MKIFYLGFSKRHLAKIIKDPKKLIVASSKDFRMTNVVHCLDNLIIDSDMKYSSLYKKYGKPEIIMFHNVDNVCDTLEEVDFVSDRPSILFIMNKKNFNECGAAMDILQMNEYIFFTSEDSKKQRGASDMWLECLEKRKKNKYLKVGACRYDL